jgi:hypothetical protein
MDYECLLFHCDWLGSDLRIGHFYCDCFERRLSYESLTELTVSVSLSFILPPTVSRPVYLGIKHPSGAYNQIFITVRQLQVCWRGALSLTKERMCRLQLRLALASAVISRVRVPWDSWPYFTVSDSRLPFSSPPTTRRVTVEVFDPASTWEYPLTELTKELCFVARGEPKRAHHVEQFVCYYEYLCFVRCYETCLATYYPATEVLPLLTA